MCFETVQQPQMPEIKEIKENTHVFLLEFWQQQLYWLSLVSFLSLRRKGMLIVL